MNALAEGGLFDPVPTDVSYPEAVYARLLVGMFSPNSYKAHFFFLSAEAACCLKWYRTTGMKRCLRFDPSVLRAACCYVLYSKWRANVLRFSAWYIDYVVVSGSNSA